ncbi:MAG: valine--tRNA ligase, partial [Nanoarchaeota archaeon]
FTNLCLAETKEAEQEMLNSWQRLGISCDWDWIYRTIDKTAIKTSQFSFIELYKQNRAYRKEAPSIWCPECATAIAQVELEDKETSSSFNDIQFMIEGGEKITIATTRPELLAACVAIIAHPDDQRYKKFIGKKATVPIFNLQVPILADKRAQPEKGTGIVMCCTFGDQTDMEWWKAYNLPLRIVITTDGKLTAKGYEGLRIKEARKKIIEDLQRLGLLKKQIEIKHIVNVHERCGTPIEFIVSKQWYIRYLDLKDKFLKLGEELKWYPEHMKNRYDNWVKGLQWDWSISRQRYFGVPFPVWYCNKCDEVNLAEKQDLPIDPLTSKPKKPCKCGSTEFTPEKDIMDTWATSSLTPQIALKWVEDEEFFKKMYPMSLRPQAHDIISFWLFNTLVKGYFHHKQLPWKNAMISGWALDAKGKKMSKSKGNVIEPQEMITKYSADALRFWASSTKLGEDLWFAEKEFVTGNRTITKLWNASRFVSVHFDNYDKRKSAAPTLLDRWIKTKLNKVIKICTESIEQYEYIHLRLDTEKFFWQILCDNYLEFIKDRLYNPDNYDEDEVQAAKNTLYEALLASLKLFAPIMPHITEEIYQHLFKEKEGIKSIHLSKWPKYNEKEVDEEAEKVGDVIVEMVAMVRKYKSQKQVSQKAPLESLTIDVEAPLVDKLK